MVHFSSQGARQTRCFVLVFWLCACSCCNVRRPRKKQRRSWNWTIPQLYISNPNVLQIYENWGEPKPAPRVLTLNCCCCCCFFLPRLLTCISSTLCIKLCAWVKLLWLSLNSRLCGWWFVRCISYICKHNLGNIISKSTCAHIMITTLWDWLILLYWTIYLFHVQAMERCAPELQTSKIVVHEVRTNARVPTMGFSES